MVLSIVVLVRDANTLRLDNCLNSLKPLSDKIEESETVICVAGSEAMEKTRKIAPDFLNVNDLGNIHEIPWNDDYAEARNRCLSYCKGSWVMYLDADELFLDADDLVEFFNGEEYRRYYSAAYISGSGRKSKAYDLPRLFKKERNIRFIGKVNEYAENIRTPLKYLNSRVVQMPRPNTNALEILTEEHEAGPENLRTILRLSDCLLLEKRFSELYDYLKKGMEQAKEGPIYHALYYKEISALLMEKKYDEAIESVNSYFADNSALYATAPEIRMIEAISLNHQKKYEEAAVSAEKVPDLLAQKQDEEISLYTSVTIYEEADVINFIATYHSQAGAFEAADDWNAKLSEDDSAKKVNPFEVFAAAAVSDKEYSRLTDLYNYAMSEKGENTAEYDNAIGAIESSMTHHGIKAEVAAAFLSAYDIRGSDYLRLWNARKLFYDSGHGIDPQSVAELRHFMDSGKRYHQAYGDLIVSAMKNEVDFVQFLDNLKVTATAKLLENMVRSYSDIGDIVKDFARNKNFTQSCHSVKCLRIISSLISAVEKTDDSLFEIYTLMRHKYLSLTTHPKFYCDEKAEELRETDAFTYFMAGAFGFRDMGDKLGYAKNLRKALEILPYMEDKIKKLAKQLKDEHEAPVMTANEQLEKETAKLKAVIYTMIYTGQKPQAAEILAIYKTANPTDPEIAKLEEMLNEP